MGNRVIYWAGQELFIFDGPNIFYMDTTHQKIGRFGDPYRGTICLVDSMESMGQYHLPLDVMVDYNLFVIQAASPDPRHKEWTKRRPGIREFVLNPPEEEEIIQASGLFSSLIPLTLTGSDFRLGLHGFAEAERIKSAIGDYGNNMRSILQVLRSGRQAVDNRIEAKLASLDLAAVKRMLEADIDAQTSHTLITSLCIQQPDPSDSSYTESDPVSRTFAGAVVYRALLRRYGAEFHRTIRFTASLYGRIGGAASARGGMWEMWCHEEIPKLRRLDLIRMVHRKGKLVQGEDTRSISIGSLTHQIYTIKDTLKFTVDSTKYYVPNEKNNATFDAFCRSKEEGIGLQMTLATTHSVAPSGLNILNKRLSANVKTKDYCFVFVIPKGQKFECVAPRSQSVFTFYTLELDDGK